jgi:hypothetical protein
VTSLKISYKYETALKKITQPKIFKALEAGLKITARHWSEIFLDIRHQLTNQQTSI